MISYGKRMVEASKKAIGGSDVASVPPDRCAEQTSKPGEQKFTIRSSRFYESKTRRTLDFSALTSNRVTNHNNRNASITKSKTVNNWIEKTFKNCPTTSSSYMPKKGKENVVPNFTKTKNIVSTSSHSGPTTLDNDIEHNKAVSSQTQPVSSHSHSGLTTLDNDIEHNKAESSQTQPVSSHSQSGLTTLDTDIEHSRAGPSQIQPVSNTILNKNVEYSGARSSLLQLQNMHYCNNFRWDLTQSNISAPSPPQVQNMQYDYGSSFGSEFMQYSIPAPSPPQVQNMQYDYGNNFGSDFMQSSVSILLDDTMSDLDLSNYCSSGPMYNTNYNQQNMWSSNYNLPSYAFSDLQQTSHFSNTHTAITYNNGCQSENISTNDWQSMNSMLNVTSDSGVFTNLQLTSNASPLVKQCDIPVLFGNSEVVTSTTEVRAVQPVQCSDSLLGASLSDNSLIFSNVTSISMIKPMDDSFSSTDLVAGMLSSEDLHYESDANDVGISEQETPSNLSLTSPIHLIDNSFSGVDLISEDLHQTFNASDVSTSEQQTPSNLPSLIHLIDNTFSGTDVVRDDIHQASNASDVSTSESSLASPVSSNNLLPGGSEGKSSGDNWKSNVRKQRRNKGLSYTAVSGKVVKERKMTSGCTEKKCRLKCHRSFDTEKRVDLFKQYWGLGDLQLQRCFIAAHVTRKAVKLRREKSKEKRQFTLVYTFQSVDKRQTVCKKFFLATLGITSQIVKTTLHKVTSAGTVAAERRHLPISRKLPDTFREGIRQHIQKLATIPSHYCRKDNKKQYLQEGKSVSEIYELYKEECRKEGNRPVAKKWLYDKIFYNEFNIGFFMPKKDQCDLCCKYERCTEAEKQVLNDEMRRHMKCKELSREVKTLAKEMAKQNLNFTVACFDLQQVLITPRSLSSQLYYRRKLATYNLSVFDLGLAEGICYMWHEGVAKRGATNIASCVYSFILEHHSKGATQFAFFSDNCGGQNKNKTVVAMYIHAVRTLKVNVDHYFMEKGHTQNEADSIHATIERASKHINVYTPQQWYTVVQTAKKQHPPYRVKEMETNMLNFDELGSHYCVSASKDVNNVKIEWNKIHVMHFEHGNSGSMFFKHDYDEAFREVKLSKFNKPIPTWNGSISPLRQTSTVTEAKKNDLLWMCNELIIPREYHQFYNDLVVSNTTDDNHAVDVEVDELAATDITDAVTTADSDLNQVTETATSDQLRVTRRSRKSASSSAEKNRSVSNRKVKRFIQPMFASTPRNNSVTKEMRKSKGQRAVKTIESCSLSQHTV